MGDFSWGKTLGEETKQSDLQRGGGGVPYVDMSRHRRITLQLFELEKGRDMDLSLIPRRIGQALGLRKKPAPLPGPHVGAMPEQQLATNVDEITSDRDIKDAALLESDRLGQARREGTLSAGEYEAALQRLQNATHLRWEHEVLTIRLDVAVQTLGPDLAHHRADEIIAQELKRVGREGWQADDLTDSYSLVAHHRVREGSLGYSWDSVEIKIKRLLATA
jgi:hypothetical protein